jgi:hypothetical protein
LNNLTKMLATRRSREQQQAQQQTKVTAAVPASEGKGKGNLRVVQVDPNEPLFPEEEAQEEI